MECAGLGACSCVGSGESGESGATKPKVAWSLLGQGPTSTGRIPSQDLKRSCSRDGMVPDLILKRQDAAIQLFFGVNRIWQYIETRE